MSNRLQQRFAECAEQNRAALVTYICGGDPNYDVSLSLLQKLPGAGADIIELGMPFSDPMADGPTIQAAAVRALNSGQTQRKTLEMVRAFRAENTTTPLVLMGYYNPIHRYGAEAFLNDAHAAGVDGLLIVDLPAEHDNELGPMARDLGLDMIRMASPTTDAKRLPRVLANASGFLYYVSLNGVTGVGQADNAVVDAALSDIRKQSDLPICVGFGVRTPEQAAAFARTATGVVVGSALVEAMNKGGEAAALELTTALAGAMQR
ncbi:tryptophan synthase subunit alpha [Pseudomonas neustonica]|uniref:Tryptophan synthase alpha chain n=1 Tax=Pseudomonas neustonica TaxID=2487346 RepID=A0ABX9XE90_9PSED|nr:MULTISPECIES: tryptophan synthase subunit alpha [Pseudomonas]ROZ80711.1 tryptophan synthase subunit alpha [Pseudomonas sp. SSM44]ROZ81865.1 tryptophan synthase subunit alpha [Pseudomonas neustonica]